MYIYNNKYITYINEILVSRTLRDLHVGFFFFFRFK